MRIDVSQTLGNIRTFDYTVSLSREGGREDGRYTPVYNFVALLEYLILVRFCASCFGVQSRDLFI
jgi:hypothetical protein